MTANDLLRMGNKHGRLRKLTHLRNRYLIGIDTLGLLAIPSIAYLLRTESLEGLAALWESIAVYTLGMIVLKWFIFYAGGLYSTLWAYTSVYELLLVARTIGLSALAEIAVSYGIFYTFGQIPPGIPRSLPILSALMTLFYVTGIRFSIRIIYSAINRKEGHGGESHPVLIAGAGSAGVMIARELQDNPHLGMIPIGFVDDDPNKAEKVIYGIPVFGVIDDIPWITSRTGIKEVIIAMPTAAGEVIRRVDRICKEAGIPSKITPGLFDLVRGAAKIESVHEVQLEDLLRRDVVGSDHAIVSTAILGRRVLVTGAGGSIGSEIVRQLKGFRPSELIILGHGETSIFHMMKELEQTRVPGMVVIPVVADVRDHERMEQVFLTHRPQIIFHAAAHKHVWLMEQNLADAVTNNILGTRVMVTLAEKYGVARFVMISSDKAVNPTSVMGVTKRVAELIVQDA
ncbi:MAG: polysaccharide biosynthesis protein, partial [Ignavibacteriae bacterium]|nr:polysaccharide biosynthesis protein [Ignavibacteriota bacterium]